MAEGKNKIIFYRDWAEIFKKLSVEEAGNLIIHFCKYITDESPESPDRITDLLFDPMKATLKRDLKKWEQLVERNRNNGINGGRPPETQNNRQGLIYEKHNPKKADKDKDKDKDKDTDIDNEIKEDNINTKTWRNDFEIYKSELLNVYNQLISDKEWILKMQKYHPNLDVLKTIEKTHDLFWSTEAGWKNKKSKRIKEIDWKSTLTNALDQKSNHVYLPYNISGGQQTYKITIPKDRFKESKRLEAQEKEWNARSPEQKAADKLMGDVVKYRILNKNHAAEFTEDQTIEMIKSGKINL